MATSGVIYTQFRSDCDDYSKQRKHRVSSCQVSRGPAVALLSVLGQRGINYYLGFPKGATRTMGTKFGCCVHFSLRPKSQGGEGASSNFIFFPPFFFPNFFNAIKTGSSAAIEPSVQASVRQPKIAEGGGPLEVRS